jgi:RimJ/RimL family protein N-acetyltransferase
VESRRLTLVAATSELVAADLAGREALAEALGADVPDEWPPELYDGPSMRVAQQQLDNPSEHGWSLWYLVCNRIEPPRVIGICGFKGKPDRAGSVEIVYSVLRPYRVQGYATEAVGRLVVWAFSHQHVIEVTAETLPHLRQSIRVMEKNGFALQGPGSEHGVVRYALQKSKGR